ncbi:MAG TPA: hypothetical protein VGO50_02880 [Pyrinomonadaceae bacterium]|jgi:hypothetical protein|nr:hypothetical protein [Pyrinomonadaceae bacterium]
MAKNRIHIGNLQIRLSNRTRGSMKDMAASVGRGVLQNIADAVGHRRGSIRIDKISAGKIKASGSSEGEIQKRAAAAIAMEIIKKIG